VSEGKAVGLTRERKIRSASSRCVRILFGEMGCAGWSGTAGGSAGTTTGAGVGDCAGAGFAAGIC
jgi:hypothetical protein